jgi:hypothetical protein
MWQRRRELDVQLQHKCRLWSVNAYMNVVYSGAVVPALYML